MNDGQHVISLQSDLCNVTALRAVSQHIDVMGVLTQRRKIYITCRRRRRHTCYELLDILRAGYLIPVEQGSRKCASLLSCCYWLLFLQRVFTFEDPEALTPICLKI